jgi:hypothetical protein
MPAKVGGPGPRLNQILRAPSPPPLWSVQQKLKAEYARLLQPLA